MNRLRKLFKDKKGISPVLAVLLMIAVAVAAALVTYAWVMGYLGTTTARAGRAIQIQSVAFEDGLDDTWGGTDDEITVYVQNVGQGSVNLSETYKDGAMVLGANLTMLPADGVLEEGLTATITISNQGLTAASDCKIKVTCVDGTFTEATQTVE